ncbi:Ribonuclease HII [Candidatus Syntrophocurvum alkaliphilum]|uniref:Ribonuclease HII n=1 Tax=Candidatus Syntrophocurvum alkaliphilum TaxID=2293317 RepID=A0A6I6DIA2_9FIRM|nr:ribonuclease HII [Candidatus Syntrophocurvum alkaliphilum]QGT99953.1 Ribonuclease HII [Candidatus Syntrophocurvum alkaliphilum]
MQEKIRFLRLEELNRLEEMKMYESELHKQGYELIAGVDEVGRGCIAGPVAASAVILPPDFILEEVDDSKKLTEKKRLYLSQEIKKQALAWAVAFINPPYLDEINILNATIEAMKLAINGLTLQPDFLLIDALKINDINIKQQSIIRGDSKSMSIACASILAKVERDNLLNSYDSLYPYYGFGKHKGYATKKHIQALFKNGVTPIHRVSFQPVKTLIVGGNYSEQPGLF